METIDKCVRKLSSGKACGPDGLSAEHLKFAHPSLVIHLCALFRAIVASGRVPDAFGSGIIVPLIKDKTGNASSLNNYRGITLISVIAKLFELVLLEICGNYLLTDDLQFGFKHNIGCPNAIFAFRSTVDYFCERGSTVYAASPDISKAFDNVNHCKLFKSLSETGIPKWILSLLANWYCKLNVAVRWNGAFSDSFHVSSGVRQGSILSPSLFTVFMNMFIVRLRTLGSGCHVGDHFVGCILYADDIILLSATVNGLQRMLNCCYEVSCGLLLTFNCSKSYCFVVGSGCKYNIADMHLGSNHIQWYDSVKYLGVTFYGGSKLKVNTNVIKQHFFAAFNSVHGNSHSLDELIQLQLHESFCLPLLQYAMCAVKLSSSQEAELNACWNTVYRRIFNYRKYDSVSTIICGLGRLDFKHLHTLWTLKFIKKCCFSQNVVVRCLGKLFTISGEFKQLCSRFDVDASSYFSHISFGAIRCATYEHFVYYVERNKCSFHFFA